MFSEYDFPFRFFKELLDLEPFLWVVVCISATPLVGAGVDLRFGLTTAFFNRDRIDLGILVGNIGYTIGAPIFGVIMELTDAQALITEVWNSGSPVKPDPYLKGYEWAKGLSSVW